MGRVRAGCLGAFERIGRRILVAEAHAVLKLAWQKPEKYPLAHAASRPQKTIAPRPWSARVFDTLSRSAPHLEWLRTLESDSGLSTISFSRQKNLLRCSDLRQHLRQLRLELSEIFEQILCGNQFGDNVDRFEDVALCNWQPDEDNTHP